MGLVNFKQGGKAGFYQVVIAAFVHLHRLIHSEVDFTSPKLCVVYIEKRRVG
jgi:hypothetical protein